MNIQHGRKVLFFVVASIAAAVLINAGCSRKEASYLRCEGGVDSLLNAGC